MSDDVAIAQWALLLCMHLLGCAIAYAGGYLRGHRHAMKFHEEQRERWHAERRRDLESKRQVDV